jgi:hypothetical protein
LYGPYGGPCQYRLAQGRPLGPDNLPYIDPNDPQPVPVATFKADQFFLGGAVYGGLYRANGFSDEQGKGDVSLIDDHLYLLKVADDGWSYDFEQLMASEVPMMSTGFKNYVDAVDDIPNTISKVSLYQQRGIITKLPAGHYISLWTFSYPGNPDLLQFILKLDPNPDDVDYWEWQFGPRTGTSIVYVDIEP